MNPSEFTRKWKDTALGERSACQQHFLDLCDLLGHPKPADVDKTGDSFTFERGAEKQDGGSGWADVWKRGFFGWEYKKRAANLRKAYDQLLLYHEALENPPLLVVSDMDIIEIHTNFTGTRSAVYRIPLSDLDEPHNLEILRAVFFEPEKLKPGITVEAVTAEAAKRIAQIAENLRERIGQKPPHEVAAQGIGEIARSLRATTEDSHLVAHFLDRLVFCMFAEDIGLLPEKLFSELLKKRRMDSRRFARALAQLFEVMSEGGDYGTVEIRRFNGNLFAEVDVLDLTDGEMELLYQAARLDWGAIDPSIFGTLFERGLDPSKRAQLGAHYTSRKDIETLVEPVIMTPLRRAWEKAKTDAEAQIKKGTKRSRELASAAVGDFLGYLGHVKILDPACGSGNFLYVTLQLMKDLEKTAMLWAGDQALGSYLPMVHPRQFYGIEISPYAHDLAQMTLWIGYLQWIRQNGYGQPSDPILESLESNFQNKDAILDLSDPDYPQEPEWPAVDFIVGNPPFLGDKMMRRELGDNYVVTLRQLYEGRIPGQSDLCCYWFEKARKHVEEGKCGRGGLLSTQGIRGGANREVLKRIKQTGDIFFAQSDREWILDGANVHVSMVGFDGGEATDRKLNGEDVPTINSDLTRDVDLTTAPHLPENRGISFQGPVKVGTFEVPDDEARDLLGHPNPHSRPNSDVLTPWANGISITGRKPPFWIVDFRELALEEAALFEAPFGRVDRFVRPEREANTRDRRRRFWWRHGEVNNALRKALASHGRYAATCQTAKHRVFAWLDSVVLPAQTVIAIARSDDYFFGVLHSRIHEVWSRAQATQLREASSGTRYTPTTCFETFPFPWTPGQEPEEDPRVQAIASVARELDALRQNWLNPPEWVKEEVLQFPGSVEGPWGRYVTNPNSQGVGTVRYPRLVAKDEASAALLKKRTLTALYNERPTWLDLAHQRLDEAVATAYGWPPDLTEPELLQRLLDLNQARAMAVESKKNE